MGPGHPRPRDWGTAVIRAPPSSRRHSLSVLEGGRCQGGARGAGGSLPKPKPHRIEAHGSSTQLPRTLTREHIVIFIHAVQLQAFVQLLEFIGVQHLTFPVWVAWGGRAGQSGPRHQGTRVKHGLPRRPAAAQTRTRSPALDGAVLWWVPWTPCTSKPPRKHRRLSCCPAPGPLPLPAPPESTQRSEAGQLSTLARAACVERTRRHGARLRTFSRGRPRPGPRRLAPPASPVRVSPIQAASRPADPALQD